MAERYESDKVFKHEDATGNEYELLKFIGKKVKRIENEESTLKIIFEDDTSITACGYTYGDDALSIECD